jgi:GR25 family glycosyltransferase involved in LPS biosynthesis
MTGFTVDARFLFPKSLVMGRSFYEVMGRVFYINLDRRPDRREFWEKQGLISTRFEAINHAPGHGRLQPGQMGCAMSHLILWKICAMEKSPMAVFEDDIILRGGAEGFLASFSLVYPRVPDDWEMIYFGGTPNWGAQPVAPNVVWSRGVLGTVGYAIKPDAAFKAAERCQKLDDPVDVMLHRLHSEEMKIYQVCPPMCWPMVDDSDVTRHRFDGVNENGFYHNWWAKHFPHAGEEAFCKEAEFDRSRLDREEGPQLYEFPPK